VTMTTSELNPKSWGVLAHCVKNLQELLDAPAGTWTKIALSRKKPIKYTVNRHRNFVLSKSDKVYVSAYTEAEARKLAEPMFGPMPDFTPDEILEAKSKIRDVITVWKT